MANKKISELQSRTPALSDLMLVGDPSSGYSYKCTVTALATIIETDIADGYVTIGTTQTISGAKTFSNNLTLTSVVNTPTDPDKFLTLNASNVVTYRTGAEVLSDIGGVGGSGTTNYLPKFSATTTLANSQIFDNGTNVGIGVGSSIIAGYLLTIGGKVKIYNQIDLDNPTTNTCNAINIQKGTSISHRGVGYIQIASFNTNRLSLFFNDNNNYQADFDGSNLTTGQRYILPNATGTLALTSDLSSYVPTSRILTINGTSYDLSANRTWSVGTVTSVAALTLGTTGTDLSSSVANGTTTPVITLNIPTASATNRGALSSTDWSTFNNKQSTITLTTTGSSGSATFVSNTLNVPTYTLAGLGGISGTGTTNYIPKFTSSSAIGNSQIQDDGTNVGVGGSPSSQKLRIYGGTIISNNNFYYGFNSVGSQATIVGISSGDNITLGQNNVNHSNTIIYGGTGNIEFSTGGSERMRLTSGGSLGIGTSTPGQKLTVNGDVLVGTNLFISNAAGSMVGATSPSFYSPASGVLGISTNGSERMRLDASGNLGLGVTPSAWSTFKAIQVNGGNSFVGAANQAEIWSNSYFDGGFKYYGTGLATRFASIDGQFQWYNAPSGTAGNTVTFTERMRLDASGNLGLGVTPSAWGSNAKALQFSGGSLWNFTSSYLFLSQNAYFDNTNQIYVNSAPASDYYQYNGQHIWRTAPSGTAGNAISFTQAMTLDASGRLGIGTTSPTYNLDLNSAGATTIRIAGAGEGYTQGALLLQSATTSSPQNRGLGIYTFNEGTDATWYFGNGYGYADAFVINRKAGTTYSIAAAAPAESSNLFTITSGGNVGIGTTSPGYKLQVQGTQQDAVQTIARFAANNSSSQIKAFDINITAGTPLITLATAAVGTDAAMAFATAGSERMRITSGGELLINTTSDAGDFKLQVSGNQYVSGSLGIATTSPSTTIDVSGSGRISGNTYLATASGNVGVGTTSPNSSALLHISSTTKGFLPPVMSGSQAEAISTPATGLMVYANNGNGTTITSTGWWGYDGTNWVKLN
jgi:hypothetical protein